MCVDWTWVSGKDNVNILEKIVACASTVGLPSVHTCAMLGNLLWFSVNQTVFMSSAKKKLILFDELKWKKALLHQQSLSMGSDLCGLLFGYFMSLSVLVAVAIASHSG